MSEPSKRSPVRHRSYDVFAVFSPDGRLQTARENRRDAESAAAIIGGTDWEVTGYTVEVVQLTRFFRPKT